ncbi:MAG: iron-sulfur cluster assembly protein [Bacteroidaceae bacterium]|nr:iron-sulfur cluster assembly protein [Bacteroidaceae bacterium]
MENQKKQDKLAVEEKIIAALKTVYDPEIPVDIYELGLIYKIDYHEEDGTLDLDMTLTAPGCPMADFIMEDVRQKMEGIEGITTARVNLVFEPEWDQSMMSEEAKADLGML